MTQGIQIFHSPRYFADLGQHIMPIRKFQLVRDAMAESGLPVRFREPQRVSDADLLRVHTAEYVRAIDTGEPEDLAKSQKFPWSAALGEAVRWTNGGCNGALAAALDDGIAGNLASGFHHSHGPHGEGFCTYNGLVIAMERMKAEGRIARGLVLDMDLHYGNGTAALLATRPWLFQLSIYGNWYKKNLAYRDVTGERADDTENAKSVAVNAGAKGEEYVGLVAEHLPRLVDQARPDVLFYQAGADPYREDPYSPLDLGHDDLRARDAFVFEFCKRKGLPVAYVLAGGYTTDVTKVVEVHVNTFRAAHAVYG